jgi:hypothetical protein
MPETLPAQDDDKLPDAEAEARFKRLVGNLVNTPHKPHNSPAQPKKEGAKSGKGR